MKNIKNLGYVTINLPGDACEWFTPLMSFLKINKVILNIEIVRLLLSTTLW